MLKFIFLVTPFQWGLYYDSDIRFWEWFIFGLFLTNVVWYSIKEPEVFFRNKVYFLVLLLPFMYVITVPFAINQEGNWNTMISFFTYSFFFSFINVDKRGSCNKKFVFIHFSYFRSGISDFFNSP